MIKASANAAAQQNFQLCQGTRAPLAAEANPLLVKQILAGTTLELGGDPLKPLFKVDVAVADTLDELSAEHSVAAVDLEIAYYDLPLRLDE